jgi:hypothetical protein
MPPTEDDLPSRWQRLDWWFAPRWRALLTWVALAMFMQEILRRFWESDGHSFGISEVIAWPIKQINHRWPNPLSNDFADCAVGANYFFLLSWFEPLALRLNLPRAAGWLAVQASPIIFVAVIVRFVSSNYYLPAVPLALSIAAAANFFVLRGWRTRPWMACIPFVLREGVVIALNAVILNWQWTAVQALFCAVALLYGTRLLTPEERALRAG